MPEISPADSFPRKRLTIGETTMAYVDEGNPDGDPIVFLHGNPTSSYLWRNIMPHLFDSARCLAPDLIGMGASGSSPSGSYRFVDHAGWLDAWIEGMDLGDRITFVIHDWGSALGYHWANRNRDRVKGLVYMEAIVRPVTWDEWPEAAARIFQGMRSEAGEDMVLQRNVFVERVLPGSVLRGLTEAEMEVYRQPYLEAGESRRPTLTWPREIPISGEPADVVEIAQSYADFLASDDSSGIAKLFINAEPGAILQGSQREFCRSWPNQTEVTVPGNHFVQEDSPHEIGEAIRDWYAQI